MKITWRMLLIHVWLPTSRLTKRVSTDCAMDVAACTGMAVKMTLGAGFSAGYIFVFAAIVANPMPHKNIDYL